MKKGIRKALFILIWLVIWQLVSLIVHNKFIIVGPVETLKALLRLTQEGALIPGVLSTCGHVLAGFALGCIVGIAVAGISYSSAIIADFIAPLMTALKTVPVASFIILVLIWFDKGSVGTVISMLVTTPILYFNTLSGLRTLDRQMLEMAHVYHMTGGRRLRYIILPHLVPFISSGIQTAFGMSWKSGVAAEVIGQPLMTVGNGLYVGKINLATDEILAWTLAVVVVSYILEKNLFLIMSGIMKKQSAEAPQS